MTILALKKEKTIKMIYMMYNDNMFPYLWRILFIGLGISVPLQYLNCNGIVTFYPNQNIAGPVVWVVPLQF